MSTAVNSSGGAALFNKSACIFFGMYISMRPMTFLTKRKRALVFCRRFTL